MMLLKLKYYNDRIQIVRALEWGEGSRAGLERDQVSLCCRPANFDCIFECAYGKPQHDPSTVASVRSFVFVLEEATLPPKKERMG